MAFSQLAQNLHDYIDHAQSNVMLYQIDREGTTWAMERWNGASKRILPGVFCHVACQLLMDVSCDMFECWAIGDERRGVELLVSLLRGSHVL